MRMTTCPYMEENDSENSLGQDQNLFFFVLECIGVGIIFYMICIPYFILFPEG